MKIKRLKKIRINGTIFKIKWDDTVFGGSFDYIDRSIVVGVKCRHLIKETLIHELMEIAAVELGVRFTRPDNDYEYVFMYDHRQHDTMCSMVAGLLDQFIEG